MTYLTKKQNKILALFFMVSTILLISGVLVGFFGIFNYENPILLLNIGMILIGSGAILLVYTLVREFIIN